MADAIRRLLDDEDLSPSSSSRNGLDLVERDFDWERRTDEFAEVLDGVVRRHRACATARRPDPPADPELSVVVLAWDNLATPSGSSSRSGGTPTCPTS